MRSTRWRRRWRASTRTSPTERYAAGACQRSKARVKADRSAAYRSSGPASRRRRTQRRRSRARSSRLWSPSAVASAMPASARASMARRMRSASDARRSSRRRSTRHGGHGPHDRRCRRAGRRRSRRSGSRRRPAGSCRSAPRRSPRAAPTPARRRRPTRCRARSRAGRPRTATPARGRRRAGRCAARTAPRRARAGRSGQGSGSVVSRRTTDGPPAGSGHGRSSSIHPSSASLASFSARVSVSAAFAFFVAEPCRSGCVRATRARQAAFTSRVVTGGTRPSSQSARAHSRADRRATTPRRLGPAAGRR